MGSSPHRGRTPSTVGAVGRLNRYGDRQLNNALHTVVQTPIQYQPATRDYVARRTAEGKTGREINAALPATSPETSTACLKEEPPRLDEA